jgi:hypothetical protein
MTYTISGTYVADCSCDLVCPCPVDGRPNHPEGKCWGAAVFHVERGNLDDVDLSGIDIALVNLFPSNLSAGNWTMGVMLDEGVSDQQANAVERIMSGQEGGPFADFAPLISNFAGVSRAAISFSNGDAPSASIGGVGNLSIEPSMGPAGPTTVKGAPFAFTPEYTIGRSSGQADILGKSVEFKYAESAAFEYSSEGEGQTARA